jgi:hypothetical protein
MAAARTTTRSARTMTTRSFLRRHLVAVRLCHCGLRHSTPGPVSSKCGRCRFGALQLRVFLVCIQAMPACLLSPQTRSNPTVTNSCRRRLCLWRPSKPFHFPTSTLAVVIGSWTLAQALTWKTTLVSSLLPLPPLAYFYNCWQRCSSSNSSLWLICHPHLVLKLHNVLISPILIKNLISVRALTRDNLVSVTFDPFGFLIKDFRTGMTLLRCDSTGELYPLRFTTNNNNSSRRSFLATHNMELWHARLGHPGHGHLHRILSTFDFMCCKSETHACSTCGMGKHVRLPFSDSINVSLFPFRLIHCDVWTSPIVSNSGFKFYLIVLDDFSHFT